MRVVRRHPIDPSIMALTSAEPPGPGNDGAPFPGGMGHFDAQDESYKSTAAPDENLINTTMETYLQDRPSSCMGCHQVVSNARGDDFVGTPAPPCGGAGEPLWSNHSTDRAYHIK